MSGDIFSAIDSFSNAITGKIVEFSSKLATGDGATLVHSVLIWAIGIEVIFALFTVINGSGQKGIQRGIEALLLGALFTGIIGQWQTIVIPLTYAIPTDVTKAFDIKDPEGLKGDIAQGFAEAITTVVNPTTLSSGKGVVAKTVDTGIINYNAAQSSARQIYVDAIKVANDKFNAVMSSTASNSDKIAASIAYNDAKTAASNTYTTSSKANRAACMAIPSAAAQGC